jgi:hypothetical protein
LVKKKVYTSYEDEEEEEEEELKPYEEVDALDHQYELAQTVELQRLDKEIHMLKNRDRFDEE